MIKKDKTIKQTPSKAEPSNSVASNTNIVVAVVKEDNIRTEEAKPLTLAETKTLAECEDIIGKGLKTFKEVADALQDVRDQRLYRAKYATFEDYCRLKWGITARYANRIVLAGEVVKNLDQEQLVSADGQNQPGRVE